MTMSGAVLRRIAEAAGAEAAERLAAEYGGRRLGVTQRTVHRHRRALRQGADGIGGKMITDDLKATKDFVRRVDEAILRLCRENPAFDDPRMFGALVYFFTKRHAEFFGEVSAQKMLFFIAEKGFEAAEEEFIGPRH